MSPELIIDAFVFLIFLGFWIVAFAILYHLVRFGIGVLPKKLAAIFLTGTVLLFCTSLILYLQVDLSALPI